MRSRAGEERASCLRLEMCVGGALCRAKRGETEARKRERVTGNVNDRPEEVALELFPMRDVWPEETSIGVAVSAELRRRVLERAPYERGRSVVQRMSDSGRRFDQVELELERAEERGAQEQRMDRGADVVAKSGQCQLRGARPAADRLLRLDDADRASGLGERDRGGKAVRPCSNHDRV